MLNVHVGAPSLALLHMMTGCWISQALYVAARLGIADLLQEGPQSYTRLAEATQTHAGALYRVLHALAGVGVFVEDEARGFHRTPLAESLCTDAPASLRAFVIMLRALGRAARGDDPCSVQRLLDRHGHPVPGAATLPPRQGGIGGSRLRQGSFSAELHDGVQGGIHRIRLDWADPVL